MNSLRNVILLVVVALFLVARPAIAADYPARPDGPILDSADLISPQVEAQLDQRLRDYNRDTGRAIIIATVPNLQGEVIEPYVTGLFTEWGIGGAERDQGLLLLVARDDRKMRIEVGYGLHPYFGGIMAGKVIREDLTPNFKAGNFDQGFLDATDAIIEHLNRSPEDAQAIAEAAAAAEANRPRGSKGATIGGVIFWIMFVLFFVFIVSRGRRGRRYRRHGVGGAIGDIVLWSAINAAMNNSGNSWSSGGGSSWGGGGGFSGGGGGGFGGFGGGMSGGGGASGGW